MLIFFIIDHLGHFFNIIYFFFYFRSSLSDLLNVVPTEVLAGAVKVLSDLSRVTSTAQPSGAATTVEGEEEEGEGEGEKKNEAKKKKTTTDEHRLTLADLQDHLDTSRRSRRQEEGVRKAYPILFIHFDL